MFKKVHATCEKFLTTKFGATGARPNTSSGVRLVLLGNPELTVQGELLNHLKVSGFENSVMECGLENDNDIDIIVFDTRWKPKCAIELKHRTSNQGPLRQLIRNLDKDRQKHQHGPLSGLPLLQIGLYTCISARTTPFIAPGGLYRLLSAGYYRGRPRHKLDNQAVAEGFELAAPLPIRLRLHRQHVAAAVGYGTRMVPPSAPTLP